MMIYVYIENSFCCIMQNTTINMQFWQTSQLLKQLFMIFVYKK